MSEFKIVIQDEISTSDVTTNLVLPLFVEYDGICFPADQWTDFADILNIWAYTLSKNLSISESKFILYFMDGPFRMDATKDKDMRLTIECISSRKDEVIELIIQCDYVELLEAVYKATNALSRMLYEKGMHQGRFESIYEQTIITSKILKADTEKCK